MAKVVTAAAQFLRFRADGARRRLTTEGRIMKTTMTKTGVLFGTLIGPARVVVAQKSDPDCSHATAFVEDSSITTMIQTMLISEHLDA